jgi:hypothetical protein
MQNQLLDSVMDRVLEMRRKQAAMSGEEVQQEAGAAPAPGGPLVQPPPPVDPATGQPMPPVDPATGQPMPPVDPATGQPMPPVDPATGQPMDPAAAGGEQPPPPTLEDLLATGDPMVKLLVEMDGKLDAMLSAIKTLMDNADMMVPASSVVDTAQHGEAPKPKASPAAPKTAMSPMLIDDTDPDVDDDDSPSPVVSAGGLSFAPEPTLKMGSASSPGQKGGKVVDTGLASATGRNRAIVNNVRQRRF